MSVTYSEIFRYWSELFCASAQLFICSGVGLILLSMYWRGFSSSGSLHGRVSEGDLRDPAQFHLPIKLGEQGRRDLCFMFLAIASLLWSAVGFFQVVDWWKHYPWGSAESIRKHLDPGTGEVEFIHLLRAVLSLLNSGCILLGAAYLDTFIREAPQRLRPILDWLRQREWWVFVGWMVLGSVFMTVFLWQVDWFPYLGNICDFVISLTTLSILIIGITRSFKDRGFPLLGHLAIASLWLQIAAQVPELDQNLRNVGLGVPPGLGTLLIVRWPLVLISKVLVSCLFLALPFSWMHQMREQDQEQGRRELERVRKEVREEMAGQIQALQRELRDVAEHPRRLTIPAPKKQPGGTIYRIRVSEYRDGEYFERECDLTPKSYLRLLELTLFRWERRNTHGEALKEELFEPDQGDRTRTDFHSLKTALGDLATCIGLQSDEKGSRWIELPVNCIDIDFEGLRRWDAGEGHPAAHLKHLREQFPRITKPEVA
jgi:hypothetical protein